MQDPDPRLASSTHKENGSGLVFVNLSDPTAESANRRLVRSNATTHSHRDPTRKSKKRAAPSTNPRRLRSQKSLSSSRSFSISASRVASPNPTTSLTGHHDALSTGTEHLLLRSPNHPSSSLIPRASVVGGSYQPFGVYPVPEQPWFSWVLDYYRHVHLPPGIAVVEKSAAEGLHYIDWHLQQSISEPSLFYMQLLNACTPLVVEGRITRQTVVWIRCMLIKALNEAIADSKRALTTATTLAVGSIALHERLYGDEIVAVEVHGRALERMIALRGGQDALEMPRIGQELLQWTTDITAPDSPPTFEDHLMKAWAPDDMREQHPGYDD